MARAFYNEHSRPRRPLRLRFIVAQGPQYCCSRCSYRWSLAEGKSPESCPNCKSKQWTTAGGGPSPLLLLVFGGLLALGLWFFYSGATPAVNEPKPEPNAQQPSPKPKPEEAPSKPSKPKTWPKIGPKPQPKPQPEPEPSQDKPEPEPEDLNERVEPERVAVRSGLKLEDLFRQSLKLKRPDLSKGFEAPPVEQPTADGSSTPSVDRQKLEEQQRRNLQDKARFEQAKQLYLGVISHLEAGERDLEGYTRSLRAAESLLALNDARSEATRRLKEAVEELRLMLEAHSQKQSLAESAPKRKRVKRPQARVHKAVKLVVLKHSGRGSSDFYKEILKVRNDGEVKAVDIGIHVRLLDAEGDLIAEVLAKGPKSLEPGEVGAYVADIKDKRAGDMESLELKLSGSSEAQR